MFDLHPVWQAPAIGSTGLEPWLLYHACVQCLVAIAALIAANPSGLTDSFQLAGSVVVAVAFLLHQGLAVLLERHPESKQTTILFSFAGSLWLWLLCLLLSMAATRLAEEEFYEEPFAALWISVLLAVAAFFSRLPPLIFALVAQIAALQHLALGLWLPCETCGSWRLQARGPGGLLLGLNGPWLPGLLLALLNAALSALQRRRHSELCTYAAIVKLQNLQESMPSLRVATSADQAVAYSEAQRRHFERAFEALERSPWASAQAALLAEPLLHAVSICAHQLQSQTAQQRELQETSEIRDQNVAGWIGSIGRSGTSGSILEYGLLEKSQSREVDEELAELGPEPELNRIQGDESFHLEPAESSLYIQRLTPAVVKQLKVGMWSFDANEVAREHGSVLKIVGSELIGKVSFISRSCLGAFLDAMEKRYLANPYHSSAHAADAANSFEVLASSSGLLQSSELPALRSVSMCVAALGHDLGHPGLNNSFQVNSRDSLAVTYNDRSVLENFHAAELERLLSHRYGPRQTKLMAIPQNHEARERQVRIALILSTDLSKHMQDLGDLRLRLGNGEFDPSEVAADQQLALTWYFRASDIGHSAKPWDIHRRWSERLVEEFHAQGDVERGLGLPLSPLCDRNNFDLSKSQTGFLQFICLPMYEELVRLDELLENRLQLRQRKKPATSVSLHVSRHGLKVLPLDDIVPSEQELKVESRLSRSFTGGMPLEECTAAAQNKGTLRIAQQLLDQCTDNMNSWKNLHAPSVCQDLA